MNTKFYKTKSYFLVFLLLLFIAGSCNIAQEKQKSISTSKPWTYWWWMGSAVNKTDLKIQINEFAESGIGGVHIIPIYGVQNNEVNDIPFLSEEWMEMVDFTITEAGKVGLGVDITLGTGWPYGGPCINEENAAKKLQVCSYDLGETQLISFDTDSVYKNNYFFELSKIVAINQENKIVDLETFKTEKQIEFNVPLGSWKLVFLGINLTNQKVKRAAPGGEGLVMNYFSKMAVEKYLNHFDSVFANSQFKIFPRAIYHDSYEVYHSDWTDDFFLHFKELRGYDLTDVLPILLDKNHLKYPTVQCDVRETLSDLLYTSFIESWANWANERGFESRNQAHGSPGNILDYYAAASIPETESFGSSQLPIPKVKIDEDYEESRFGRPDPLMMKFASSPAHLLNKKLVSSETATWLGNHFKVSLSQIKPQIDELFVAGINHVFYHGSTYSPVDEGFPGWLFYASSNFGRNSHFKNELPRLNEYVQNCQSILQNSSPDNDILLYFPIHDLWTKHNDNLLLQLDVHKCSKWFGETPVGQLSGLLWKNGYSFDFISDRQITELRINVNNKLSINEKSSYSLIVVPEVDFISKSTLEELEKLAQKGATIVFAGGFPKHYAGFKASIENDAGLSVIQQSLGSLSNVILAKNGIQETLSKLFVRQEKMKIQGLDFIRIKRKDKPFYFVANLNNQFYEDSISLSSPCNFIEIYDPLSNKKGYVELANEGKIPKVFLKLPPGKSYFLYAHQAKPDLIEWQYSTPSDTIRLKNEWTVNFISGNTEKLAGEYRIDSLTSWTMWNGTTLKYFSGKAKYSSTFKMDANSIQKSSYRLCLDDVRETAEVFINGFNVGTIWSVPYQLEIPQHILKPENKIELIVQNLSANRIIEIDKAGVYWKKFKEINFVDIKYKPFDASTWEPSPSGIIGEVYLVEYERGM
jgi:hypothetical protein